jgi:hypothetical protein
MAGFDFRPGNKWAEYRRVLSHAGTFGIAVLQLEKKIAGGSDAWVRGSASGETTVEKRKSEAFWLRAGIHD